ncbi:MULTISPECIES: alpha/beta fold hydrolase [unclassified Nocardioides]|uniref:alpha/beta fold hydrolase n=1 Tax=unclassified Nocardioides TaxID=2615069 RepID=UPI00361694A3
MRLIILGVLTALLAPLLPGALSSAAAAPDRPRVVSRAVTFEVENTNSTSALCFPDEQTYDVRARLVGPRRAVAGTAGTTRINVLVHDDGAGGWFWRLPGADAHDYAARLARRGETTLVLDRLGYGASDRADSSCLAAQADVLHQVVQHLRSGVYEFVDERFVDPPAAAHVVTHGHGAGAAIAQLEAGTFDDVAGVVLMSWTDGATTQVARQAVTDRRATCATGADGAPVAADAATARGLLFARAPGSVQSRATSLLSEVPCGDVLSRTTTLAAVRGAASRIEAPVLLMYGDADALTTPQARSGQPASYAAEVTTRTFAGAGNALPLERPAQVGNAVLRWLG